MSHTLTRNVDVLVERRIVDGAIVNVEPALGAGAGAAALAHDRAFNHSQVRRLTRGMVFTSALRRAGFFCGLACIAMAIGTVVGLFSPA